MPSKASPFSTLTSILSTSQIFAVLFGCAYIASARSNPTLEFTTSKAATYSMSPGSKPPKL
jgi:hypothetical protein